MTLGELIEMLRAAPPDRVLRNGLTRPHSYRGYYEQLAFEPAINVRVGDMLDDAQSALGTVFQGYKGGDFKMHEYTMVWAAPYGETGDGLSRLLLEYMLADEAP